MPCHCVYVDNRWLREYNESHRGRTCYEFYSDACVEMGKDSDFLCHAKIHELLCSSSILLRSLCKSAI